MLLQWNCLEIILSAAHLAFGSFAKRLLALFWNKGSHLYWDFGSIPCCRIFSKLLGASLPHFISWLFWLPPSYFYSEATKIFSSALSLSTWSKSHWTPLKVSQQTFSDSSEKIKKNISSFDHEIFQATGWDAGVEHWGATGRWDFHYCNAFYRFSFAFVPTGRKSLGKHLVMDFFDSIWTILLKMSNWLHWKLSTDCSGSWFSRREKILKMWNNYLGVSAFTVGLCSSSIIYQGVPCWFIFLHSLCSVS